MPRAASDELDALPLRSRTPPEWGVAVLADPIALLIDHAFLEKKAANNAMDMMTRWPGEWLPGWVETMTNVARDEAAHLGGRDAASLGGVRTTTQMPGTMAFLDIPAQERVAMGIEPGLVRVSLGIEAADDIIADLEQAINLMHLPVGV